MADNYEGEIHFAITMLENGNHAIEMPGDSYDVDDETGEWTKGDIFVTKVYEGTLVECCEWIKEIDQMDRFGDMEDVEIE